MIMKKSPLPQAIFFDWDGTLVDSYGFLEGAHNHVMDSLEMPPREPGWFEVFFGRPREEIYVTVYGKKGAEAQRRFERYVSQNHHQIRPMEGAEDLLQAVQALSLKSGVISNKKGDFIRTEIKALGWKRFFASIIGGGEADGSDKPDAKPLLFALEQAGIRENSQDIWYVGDTEIDLLCAQNAGCHSIFLGDSGKNQAIIAKYQPLRVFENCTQFHRFLLQCTEN